MERLRESGREPMPITGRELDQLIGVRPRLDLFDRVAAENGGLDHAAARVVGGMASGER
jgi:hydroxymethylpyrimidine pyrophosphatase-like HAD family hydrolase